MELKHLERLSLRNRVLSLNLKSIKPAAAPFSLPPHPVLLEISAQGAEFILACADSNALLSLPGLKERQDLVAGLQLPQEILAAFLELCLDPSIKQAGKALETTIIVTGYGVDFDPAKFPLSFAFYYQEGEIQLPLILMCRNTAALNNLLQKLDEIYVARSAQFSDPALNSCSVTLKLIAGMSVLSVSELDSLEEGDAIVIDRFCLKDDRLIVGFKDFLANAAISAGHVTLQGPFVKSTLLTALISQDKETPMSDAQNTAPQASDLQSMDELKLEISFVVDRQVMTLAQLKELQEGSEIALTNHDLSNVLLEVNGQTLASGRIIDLGDRFGFQILRKGK